MNPVPNDNPWTIRFWIEFFTLARECGFFEGYDKSYDFEARQREWYGIGKLDGDQP